MDNSEKREKTMRKSKHLKRRIAITMFILSGVCLTGLSMFMAVGSDRL
jgi:hypothetical protein